MFFDKSLLIIYCKLFGVQLWERSNQLVQLSQVAFLHLLAPLGATAASTPAVSSRVRQRLVGQSNEFGPTTSATWAQLLQIYDQVRDVQRIYGEVREVFNQRKMMLLSNRRKIVVSCDSCT